MSSGAMSHNEPAAAMLNRFAVAVDGQAFDEAIDLFTDNGEYRVYLRSNYERGGVLSLISENVPRLRARCAMHRIGPPENVRHVVGPAELTSGKGKDTVSATASFTASYGGQHVFAGEYRAELRDVNGDWRIDRLLVLLDGDSVAGAIRTLI